MNIHDYISFIPSFMKKLKQDGMSKTTVEESDWIINHFKKYCLKHNINEIDMTVIKTFYEVQYDIDIYQIKTKFQTVLRRPLLIFMEFYETGNYYKTHQKSVKTKIPKSYFNLFMKIQKEFINTLDICIKAKERKLWITAKFLSFLDQNDILNINELDINDVSNYISSINTNYSESTMRIFKSHLRELLNWLNNENLVSFTGRQAFPLIRKDNRGVLLSSYTPEEITKLLDVVNRATKNGKAIYFILSITIYLGLRAGDVINLKFDNINWEKNQIHIIQNKTQKELILPLIDEVKFPLLDYIKNGRHECKDKEYILTSLYAPYTKMNSTSSIHKIVTRTMELAGVSYEGKHHGPHSLRHSLATNMINQNVPVSAISQVLGHSNTRTTEIYITKDTRHLKDLSLEVPYAF